MTAAHKGLHLNNADFNAVVEDLQAAMDKVGLPFATQNRFLARLAPMQHQVVSR
jgi:hemoglobin